MNIFSGLLSITNPWWLLGIPASAAALAFLYRKRSRGLPLVVPSTFIWRQLSMEAQAPKKNVIPWRFLFDWLLCSLLCIAASQVSLVKDFKHAVLLIDNSFSTFSRVPVGTERQTALELIQESAKRAIRKNRGLTWTVFQTSPVLEKIGQEELDTVSALSIIDSINSGYSNDNLERALATTQSYNEESKIFVVTDRPLSRNSLLSSSSIDLVSVRDNTLPWSNIAITGADTIKGTKGEGSSINVSIRSFAPVEVELEVIATNLSSLNSQAATSIALPPNTTRNAILPASLVTSVKYKLEVRLKNTKDLQYDLVAQDNTYWLSGATSSEQILILSDLSSEELGLESLEDYSFEVQPVSELPNIDLQNYSGVIFHRVTKESLPQGNYMFVYPQSDTNYFKVGPVQTQSFVKTWDSENKLLRYISLSNFNLPESVALSSSSWLQAIVESSEGPLVLEGEDSQTRLLATGFEIFPYQGMKTPRLSILTLNFLKWLTSNSSKVSMYSINSIPALSGKLTKVAEPLSATPVKQILEPGLYSASSATDGERLMAVNYYNAFESNNLSPKALEFTDTRKISRDSQTVADSLVASIAWIILGLLVLEVTVTTFPFLRQNKLLK